MLFPLVQNQTKTSVGNSLLPAVYLCSDLSCCRSLFPIRNNAAPQSERSVFIA